MIKIGAEGTRTMTDFERIMDYAGGTGELAHNRRAFHALLEAVKRGNVVPFVGAGMSSPVYPLWPAVLKTLAEQLGEGTPEQEEFQQKFDADDAEAYTKAADYLDAKLSGFAVKDMLRVIFNKKKLTGPAYESLTAHILPSLFPNTLAITTNFERTLEHIYQDKGRKFEHVLGLPAIL